jgi:hypothetical protein
LKNKPDSEIFKKMNEFWKDYLKNCKKMENIEFSYCLNDNGDVLIRVMPTDPQYTKKVDSTQKQKGQSQTIINEFDN